MTAITVGTIGNRAFLITDAGEVDAEGRLTAIRSKVFRAPSLSLAVAYEGLGNVDFIKGFFQVRNFQTQSDALRAVPELSRAILEAGMKEYPGEFEPFRHGHRLYVLAYRPDAGPVIALCGTDQLSWGPSYEPFSLATMPGYSNMTVPAHASLSAAEAELPAYAWRVLEAQRTHPWPDGKVAVRGFGELVTVGPEGVQSEVVGRWDADRDLVSLRPALKQTLKWPTHFVRIAISRRRARPGLLG